MAKKLHPRIQALRNSIGHLPIHRFIQNRKTSSDTIKKYSPKIQKRENADEREVEQYFCIWGVKDDYGTMPMKGCFKKSINERGPSSEAPGKIVVLDGHRQSAPVCNPSELKEDDIGLYGRYSPDKIPRCDDLLVQIRSGTINNGSYGFNYVWDMMEYDEKEDCIRMYECILEEVSPCVFGSQRETFVIRNQNGIYIPSDEELCNDTESLIKKLPRQYHLEIRSLLNRHISLALNQPIEEIQKSLNKRSKPKQGEIDLGYLTKNLNF